MTSRLAVLAALLLSAGMVSIFGQTYAQRLEEAIYTQETLGNVEAAVAIYRELVTARGVPETVAQQASSRIAQIRSRAVSRPNQDRAGAVSVETELRLRDEVAQVSAAQEREKNVERGFLGMWSGNYNTAMEVLVTGAITQVEWVNPLTIVFVESAQGQKWGFTISAPNSMFRAGFTRNSFPLGEQVLVRGYAATGRDDDCPKKMPHACTTLIGGAIHAAAVSIVSTDNRKLFDRAADQNRMRQAPAN